MHEEEQRCLGRGAMSDDASGRAEDSLQGVAVILPPPLQLELS